jgi:hypothetical protein
MDDQWKITLTSIIYMDIEIRDTHSRLGRDEAHHPFHSTVHTIVRLHIIKDVTFLSISIIKNIINEVPFPQQI